MADLTVATIKLYDELLVKTNTFAQGDDITLVYDIKNIGWDEAKACKSIGYIDDPTNPILFYDDSITLYNAQNIFFSHKIDTSNLTVGDHTIYIVADYYNQLTEEIETNNLLSYTFTIEEPIVIPPENHSPTATNSIPDQMVTEGKPVTVTIPVNDIFSDVDGDSLSYSVSNLPDYLTFDSVTNTLSGFVPSGAAVVTINIAASDPGGLSASVAFKLFINHAPTGKPTINNTSPRVSQTLTLDHSSVTDPDGIQGPFTGTWEIDGVTVGTGQSYVVKENDIGKTITGKTTYLDGLGKIEEAVAITDPVASLNMTLYGKDGNDILVGDIGDDTFVGGLGADIMIGGLGNDTYFVDNANDTTIEKSTLLSEIDAVVSSVSYQLAANVENLQLTGTMALNGKGNDLNNTLLGNAGKNTIEGGRGADIMNGCDGNDIYIVDNINDIVFENYGDQTGGVDTISSYVSFSIPEYIENIRLQGIKPVNATGNLLNNLIYGNNANNVLNAGKGNDKLVGVAGNDTLVGGAGKDTLTGGLGSDKFKFNTINETGLNEKSRDIITDFNQNQNEHDKIDLSTIDANTSVALNNAFSNITVGGSFSGLFQHPAELFFETKTGIFYANNDTDPSPDFEIQLTGVSSLSLADFIL